MQALREAYKIIFDKEPPAEMPNWQVAEKVMENFNVPKLGEELAGEVIYEAVLDTEYPDDETRIRVVGRAEGFASELWDDLPDEVHMADLDRKRYFEKSRGDIKQETGMRK